MSDFDELNTKLTWLVESMKFLLSQQYGVTVTPPVLDDLDEDEDVAQGTSLPQPTGPPPCSHNQQALVDGVLQCAKCGHRLLQTGVMSDPKTAAANTEWGRNAL